MQDWAPSALPGTLLLCQPHAVGSERSVVLGTTQVPPRGRSVLGCLTRQPGWQILRWSWCGRRLAWAELSSRSERMAQEVPRPAQDPGFPLCNLEVWARASGLQVSLSQSCRLSSILLTPAQACFRLASSRFLDFFPGLLPALSEIPSRKFVGCYKMMQICCRAARQQAVSVPPPPP